MRIYVAGPMTGIAELNFPAFHAATARLRGIGHVVINPAEVNPDPKAKWTDCMREDIRELVTCDAVALLPGWEKSRGASLEHHIATALGMPCCAADEFPIAKAPHSEPPAHKGGGMSAGIDHGVLSIPGRTSGINAELDRHGAKQRAAAKADAKDKAAAVRKARAAARAAVTAMTVERRAEIAKRLGISGGGVTKGLLQFAYWEPERCLLAMASEQIPAATGEKVGA